MQNCCRARAPVYKSSESCRGTSLLGAALLWRPPPLHTPRPCCAACNQKRACCWHDWAACASGHLPLGIWQLLRHQQRFLERISAPNSNLAKSKCVSAAARCALRSSCSMLDEYAFLSLHPQATSLPPRQAATIAKATLQMAGSQLPCSHWNRPGHHQLDCERGTRWRPCSGPRCRWQHLASVCSDVQRERWYAHS